LASTYCANTHIYICLPTVDENRRLLEPLTFALARTTSMTALEDCLAPEVFVLHNLLEGSSMVRPEVASSSGHSSNEYA
jgi:hypothetical protein